MVKVMPANIMGTSWANLAPAADKHWGLPEPPSGKYNNAGESGSGLDGYLDPAPVSLLILLAHSHFCGICLLDDVEAEKKVNKQVTYKKCKQVTRNVNKHLAKYVNKQLQNFVKLISRNVFLFHF